MKDEIWRDSLSLSGLVYLSSPQLSHISVHRETGGVNQWCHHSLCPTLLERLWLRHKCCSKQSWPQWHCIYSLYLLLLGDVWVIRHRSVVDVFFPTEERSSAGTAKVRFSCRVFCRGVTLCLAVLTITDTSPWRITWCKIIMKKLTWKEPDPTPTSATGIYHPIYHVVRMK